jgi:hypothetical protein
LYQEKYGEAPSKHKQHVDGAARMINSYMERDRGLLEKAVLAVLAPPPPAPVTRVRFTPMQV